MTIRAVSLVGLLALCGHVTAAASQERAETPASFKTDDDDAPMIHRDSQGVQFYLKNFEDDESGGPNLKRAKVHVIGQPGSSRDMDEMQTFEVSCDPAKPYVKGPMEEPEPLTVHFDPTSDAPIVADSEIGTSNPHLAAAMRGAVCQ